MSRKIFVNLALKRTVAERLAKGINIIGRQRIFVFQQFAFFQHLEKEGNGTNFSRLALSNVMQGYLIKKYPDHQHNTLFRKCYCTLQWEPSKQTHSATIHRYQRLFHVLTLVLQALLGIDFRSTFVFPFISSVVPKRPSNEPFSFEKEKLQRIRQLWRRWNEGNFVFRNHRIARNAARYNIFPRKLARKNTIILGKNDDSVKT